MKLRSRIIINAPPEKVWLWIGDPVQMQKWNENLVGLERRNKGPLTKLEKFRQTYRLSGKNQVCDVVATDCTPPSRLEMRLRQLDKNRESFAIISFELEPVTNGTRVIQTMDLSQGNIPWILRMVIWLLFQFGDPVRPGFLGKLKELVEANPPLAA